MDFEYRKNKEAFQFLVGTFRNSKLPARGKEQYHSAEPWRELEQWAKGHANPELRQLASRAFDTHDVCAMNTLRLEYDWLLERMEKDTQAY